MNWTRYRVVVLEQGNLLHCYDTNVVNIEKVDDKITITMPDGRTAKREDIIATLVEHYLTTPLEENNKLPAALNKMLRDLVALERDKIG